MIVELFGPPGVGKTTFASALTAALRERGVRVDPVMSYRPAELHRGARQSFASVRRLVRPVAEVVHTTGNMLAGSQDAEATAALFRLLPTKNLMWAIRLRQYTLRLFHSWRIAEASEGVVIFDQAWIQAVCSLALLGRAPDRRRVRLALDMVPEADLLVSLHAPQESLAARLRQRQRDQGRLEQLLELDLDTNLASLGIISDLLELLEQRGVPVVRVGSADPDTLRTGVAHVVDHVLAQAGPPRRQATEQKRRQEEARS
ncbi:MAG: AAA family ATPase [Acetobacteraceae bacterium]|nr:AAA family ATPase [Acetobacteraceae bacterium]